MNPILYRIRNWCAEYGMGIISVIIGIIICAVVIYFGSLVVSPVGNDSALWFEFCENVTGAAGEMCLV